jgi:hypothetical protein
MPRARRRGFADPRGSEVGLRTLSIATVEKSRHSSEFAPPGLDAMSSPAGLQLERHRLPRLAHCLEGLPRNGSRTCSRDSSVGTLWSGFAGVGHHLVESRCAPSRACAHARRCSPPPSRCHAARRFRQRPPKRCSCACVGLNQSRSSAPSLRLDVTGEADLRPTRLTGGDATLLSSQAGDPRAVAGDTTGAGQALRPTASIRVSPSPARDHTGQGGHQPPGTPTMTVRPVSRDNPSSAVSRSRDALPLAYATTWCSRSLRVIVFVRESPGCPARPRS